MITSKPICIIPAKAASQRLPKKNILKICGKSAITYVIEAAQESDIFSNIIVSTESAEVQAVSEKSNVTVHKRADYLAHDPYGVVDVVLDVLQSNLEYRNHDELCILLPTSPLIQGLDIINAYNHFKNHKINTLFSVSESAHSAFRSITIKDGLIYPIFEQFITKKSQELEPTYDINAAISILDMKVFLKEKSYFIKPIGAYELPSEKAVDIDTAFDFEFATFLMQKRMSS